MEKEKSYTRGIIVILLLRSVRPISAISIPSMRILPSAASTKRKNERASVDFPHPVLPKRGKCQACGEDYITNNLPPQNTNFFSRFDREIQVMEYSR